MKINVEESIRGLWLASGSEGYLGTWFPRLSSNVGRLIPLSPGINVFYGRNGAGKTQMLEAIARAADFKMSAYEGFILHNPKISQVRSDFYARDLVFNISPEDLLTRYVENRTEEMMLGWTSGFDPDSIEEANQKIVLEIFKEFLACKNALLTRSPTQDPPSVREASKMNPPEFIQIVPLLLPTDFAPKTRSHAKEIYASYLQVSEKIKNMDPGDDPGLTVEENDRIYRQLSDTSNKLFEEWLELWSWSPLINLRNLESDWTYSAGAGDDENCNLWDSENRPIFLPALVSYDARPEYEEFLSSRQKTVSLSLTRESATPTFANNSDLYRLNDELSEVKREDINYRNKDPKSLDVDQPEIYKKLLADYLAGLRSKLKFLPNFRGLDYREFSNTKNPYLIFTSYVVASRGSAAERRWLKLARETMGSITQWVVIDEPEAGLHRTAESELASTLSSASWNRGSVVVVATHSPEFLDIPNAHVLHIDDGRVRELTPGDRDDLISLGLRAGDLLTGIRTFLLVEGEHERIIFENLFEEELRRARCKIIVARGAKNMKDIFDSQMIFNFSDATVISLLDNMNSAQVNSIWKEAKKLAEKGKLIEAGQYVRTSLPRDKSGENVFLSQFLTLALANGQYERVEVWGLSKLDIVLYFEPKYFGLTRSWDELLALHTSSDPSFKLWASRKYGADFGVEVIDKVSKSMSPMPDEFGDLMMRISELSNRV